MAATSSPAAVTVSFADLTLEELLDESVTSVSKKETRLFETPSAITVISNEEISKLGITHLAEALRLAPGINVARMDASHWAVSARGFNATYGNKLLVLQDGRSLFTPTYGGVFWRQQDMMLEDLKRIEVIRGPGASLWGANAVNGVINITSKHSRDTQGWLLASAVGSQEQSIHSIRYGGQLNDQLHYRASFKTFDHDQQEIGSTGNGDFWDSLRGGFRMDLDATPDDVITLQGDYYEMTTREPVEIPSLTPPYVTDQRLRNVSSGGNLLGRWTRHLSQASHWSLQAYFDHVRAETGLHRESRDAIDVEFEHRFALGDRHDFQWGLGYRYGWDELNSNAITNWDPLSRGMQSYHVFAQDEIKLIPDRLSLTLGSKFEHNTYTGWEIQPSARTLWKISEQQSLWAAVSRAVATPDRASRDSIITAGVTPLPSGAPGVIRFYGTDGFISETLLAFEVGYRHELHSRLSLDFASFYNVYHHLIEAVPGAPVPLPVPPQVELPYELRSSARATSYGFSVSANWRPFDFWQIQASYSWLYMDISPGPSTERGSPSHQAGIRSYLTMPHHMELNAAVYFVDEVSPLHLDGSYASISSYVRADMGLVWRPRSELELGIWGHNLLDGRHPEYNNQGVRSLVEIPRSVMAKVTWRF